MSYKYEYLTKNSIPRPPQHICNIFVTKQQNAQNSSVIQNTCIIARVALTQLYYLNCFTCWACGASDYG